MEPNTCESCLSLFLFLFFHQYSYHSVSVGATTWEPTCALLFLSPLELTRATTHFWFLLVLNICTLCASLNIFHIRQDLTPELLGHSWRHTYIAKMNMLFVSFHSSTILHRVKLTKSPNLHHPPAPKFLPTLPIVLELPGTYGACGACGACGLS